MKIEACTQTSQEAADEAIGTRGLWSGFVPADCVQDKGAVTYTKFGQGGRRGFGRRRGSFGLFRILFVLLFTTVLGPIVLVALLAFVAYRFYASSRSR